MSQDEQPILWDDAFKYKLLGFLKGWGLEEKQLSSIEKCIDVCITNKLSDIKTEMTSLRASIADMCSSNQLIDQRQDAKIQALKVELERERKQKEKDDSEFKVKVGWALAVISIAVALLGLLK